MESPKPMPKSLSIKKRITNQLDKANLSLESMSEFATNLIYDTTDDANHSQ